MTKVPYETLLNAQGWGQTNFRHLGDLSTENENWWREWGRALERALPGWDRIVKKPTPA